MRYVSEGVLHYSVEPEVGHKLSVTIDPGIADLYRALVPKVVRIQKPRFPPHISVIRKESVPNLDLWGKYEGLEVDFEYDSYIYNDETYYWLRCYSPALVRIRRDLGLDDLSFLARPPDLADCFHTTLGNTKSAQRPPKSV
jgi:hypothetical protein